MKTVTQQLNAIKARKAELRQIRAEAMTHYFMDVLIFGDIRDCFFWR